jgi:hypothetical protein
MQTGHPAKVFGVSFVISLVTAASLAAWSGSAPPLETALEDAALAGLGLFAASFGIDA